MATAPLDVDVPDIQPDFSAPFFAGFQVIASYILAGAMLVVPDHADHRGRLPRVPWSGIRPDAHLGG